MKIEFVNFSKKTFPEFREKINESEKEYPEKIRSKAKDYLEIIQSRKSIGIIILVDGIYVGNMIGGSLVKENLKDYSIQEKLSDSIYVYNMIIDPPYRGKGLGVALLKEFIRQAKLKGFKSIHGHFRQNTSAQIIIKEGAEVKKIFQNWEKSGETFIYAVLKI